MMPLRCAAFAATLAATGVAVAQPAETPEQLQARAQGSFDRGDARGALELARRAAAVRTTPRLLRFMAVMHYELGEVPESVDLADQCVLASQTSEDPVDRTETLGVCRRMTAELGAQVARLVVRPPPSAAPTLRVFVQGAELPRARWGAPYPVRPGALTVEARDGAAVVLRRELDLAAGAREAVDLPAPVAPVTPVTPTPRPNAPPPPMGPARVRAAPWILAGAGAALFLGGNLLFVARDAAVDARDGACPGGLCDGAARAAAQGHDDDARAWQAAGYVTLGLGAAALVGGAVWGLLDLRAARPVTAAPAVRVTASGAALGLSGSF